MTDVKTAFHVEWPEKKSFEVPLFITLRQTDVSHTCMFQVSPQKNYTLGFEGVPVSAALGGTARSFQEEIYEQQREAAGQNIQLTVADYTEVNEMLCHCSDLL